MQHRTDRPAGDPLAGIPTIADADLPEIAVGLLNHNRAPEVLRSLEIITALDYPPDKLHLIVVDNASTDGTPEKVRERYGDRVEVIRMPENMAALGRNEVITGRPERYVFQFDEDCAPADPDTLRRAVEIFEAYPEIGALCFRSINQFSGQSEWADFRQLAVRRYGDWGYQAISVIGNGMGFRSAASQRTRGYDRRIFWGSEELQLGLELTYHEIPIVYVPSLALVHRHAPRKLTRTQVTEIEIRNIIITALTFFRLPIALLFAAGNVGKRLLGAAVRRRQREEVAAVFRGMRRGLVQFREVMGDRRVIPLGRIARHHRWFVATVFSIPGAPTEPEDAARVARSRVE